jgi:anti-sigma factor RsiW
MTCDELRGKLAAYADSELPAAESAELESHLRGCNACAAEAAARFKMKQMIRAAGLFHTPTPEFRNQLQRSIAAGRRPAWLSGWLPRLAVTAAAAVVLIACVALWIDRSQREHSFAELADIHIATLASASPVDVVSTDRHTVKPWFAGRIPFTFNLPELQNTEFTLAGGRVTYFHQNPGAQLLFNLRKHQISVFIFRDQAGVLSSLGGDQTDTRLAFHLESFATGGLRYFIVGDAPASDLHALAELLKRAARS